MLRPRFEGLALRYGCHDGRWTFPDENRPVVIAGGNGTGKTTLIEGLVRTLFGFDRRRPDDAAEAESRHPWAHDMMRGQVILARNGERFEIRRDFTTNQVRVHAPDEGVDHFLGDGNPAARNQEARHFRQILTDLIGLRDLDGYRNTLLIRQGSLPDTALGDHLLRVAAGGHARVESARREIAHAHRAVTRRPLHAAAASAINARELEKVDEEIAAVRTRLAAATEAGAQRGPLALDRDRTAARLETLNREIELLEEALSVLAHTDSAELHTRSARQRVRELESAARELHNARDDLDDARSAREEAMRGGRYPDDLPERLARAEVRWRDIEESRRPPVPALGLSAIALLALAAGLVYLDEPLWAAIAAGGGVLAGAAWTALRVMAGRRMTEALKEVTADLEGVPRAAELGPQTTHLAVAAYRAQQEAVAREEKARDDLADALRRGRALLRTVESAPDWRAADGDDAPSRRPAARTLDRLRAAADHAREKLARGQVELERIGDVSLNLPTDVPPTEEAVTEALRARRAERQKVQKTLQEVSQALVERGTATESVEALESLLASLEPRREALARKAEVLEAAHALITDAYDAFRDRDQDRLVSRISHHARRLGSGRLEGVEVEDTLEDAAVRTRGRRLPMSTPPLSFGEFHALQLGVRMGAADFLAGIGIIPPLIIDEPFAHLDDDRSRSLWDLLVEVAAERQVVITTQETRLLSHFEIEPTIQLGERREHGGEQRAEPRGAPAGG